MFFFFELKTKLLSFDRFIIPSVLLLTRSMQLVDVSVYPYCKLSPQMNYLCYIGAEYAETDPAMLPCETPCVTGRRFQSWSSNCTYWCLLHR